MSTSGGVGGRGPRGPLLPDSDRLSIVTNGVRLDVVTVNKLDELSVALLGSLLTVTWFVPQ